MTDTGSSSLPPGGRAQASKTVPTPSGVLSGRAISIAQALSQRAQATTITGVVVGENKDGSTKIRTESGDVDVMLRGRDKPAAGADVEITIPPARSNKDAPNNAQPARQVSVRELPPNERQTVPQPATPENNSEQSQPEQSRAQPYAPIVTRPTLPPELQNSIPQTQITRPAPPPAPLQPDTIIRLIPLSPTQIYDVILPTPQNGDDVVLPAAPIRAAALPAALPANLIYTDTTLTTVQPKNIQSASLPPVTSLPPLLVTPSQPITGTAATMSTQQSIFFPPQTGVAQPPQTIPLALLTQGTTLTPPQLTQTAFTAMAEPDASHNMMLFKPISSATASPAFMPQPMGMAPTQSSSTATPPTTMRAQTMDARITAIDPGAGLVRLVAEKSNASMVMPHAHNPVLHAHNAITNQATIIGHMPTNKNPVAVVHAPFIAPNKLFAIQWTGDMPMIGMTMDLLPRFSGSIMGAATMHDGTMQPGITPPGITQPGAIPGSVAGVAGMPPFTPASILFSDWDWPAMDDMMQSLSVNAPHIAAATARMIPNAASPAQAGSAMMFLFAAIRANDIAGWLGDNAMAALRRDPRGMQAITRMGRDIAGLQRTDADPVSQDWKGLTLPMMWQNDIHKINLFYRHQRHDQDDESGTQKGGSTRFIFDLQLDRMGDMQIDGLMQDKRLDLILRTREQSFSPSMQSHMRGLYVSALENAGIVGHLGFQSRAQDWVRVDVRHGEIHASA